METIAENVSSIIKYIFSQLSLISFTDVLDIIILAAILYYAYRFIRDRRAGKLAIGLFLLILILSLSNLIGLHAVSYLLQNFFQVGIIALLIVFQPELRSALEKVGDKPWNGLRSITEQKDMSQITAMVEAVCEAVCDLSRDKTGALIVFERSTKLGDIVKSGVVINADVNPFLLRNIFFNKAPMHDGAVVIRNFRINAAGCFLPLSTNQDIIKDLGTRHRAAIGMSEASDAAVVVVSEETGVISLAFDGKLKRHYNYNTLKQDILSLMVQTPAIRKKRHGGQDDGLGSDAAKPADEKDLSGKNKS